MANRFTAGKNSISECDRCGQRFKLKDLKKEVIKTKQVAIKVCNECWSPDHPQLQLGMYPVADPQAVRDPRPDFAGYAQSRSNIVPVQNFLNSEEYTSAGGAIGTVTFSIPAPPPPPPAACDPYFAYVSLLLHMDGSNGSTTFTDNSPSPKTVTPSGSAAVSTSQVKWGTGSVYFDGVTPSRLTVPNSADFNFGSGSFTVEFWSRVVNGTGVAITLGNGALSIVVDFQGAINVSKQNVASLISTSSNRAPQGTWTHVAVVQDATNLKVYAGGVYVNNVTVAAQTWANANGIYIGAAPAVSPIYNFTGYIDDLRITKGVARYTANFTPPAAAFPDIICPANGAPVDSSIKFLMSFDGDFTEANGLITTQNSSPVIESTIAKFGSGSLGTVNGVASVSAAGLPSRASGDPFTIEAWFYVTNNLPGGGWDIIKAHGNASLQLYAEVSPNFNYYVFRLGANFIGYQAGPTTYPVNQWVHMRGVWQSGTGYLFINGVLWDSRALSAAGGTNNTAIVGPFGSSSMSPRNLFIDEAAIFNTAVTTSNFTPPTTAYARV